MPRRPLPWFYLRKASRHGIAKEKLCTIPTASLPSSTKMRSAITPPVELHEIKAHINSAAFIERVLQIFDRWVEAGIVPAGRTNAAA